MPTNMADAQVPHDKRLPLAMQATLKLVIARQSR
jgi:hypothetical protein